MDPAPENKSPQPLKEVVPGECLRPFANYNQVSTHLDRFGIPTKTFRFRLRGVADFEIQTQWYEQIMKAQEGVEGNQDNLVVLPSGYKMLKPGELHKEQEKMETPLVAIVG